MFAGHILTAYAAARIPAAAANADLADDLVASMLTAGLDRDAAAWSGVVEEGSMAWALVTLADSYVEEAMRTLAACGVETRC